MVFDTMRTGFEVSVCLGTNVLMITKTYKYLRHIVRDDLSDEDDIKSKERSLYGRSNLILRQFYFCSTAVKNRLVLYYCSVVYKLCVLYGLTIGNAS